MNKYLIRFMNGSTDTVEADSYGEDTILHVNNDGNVTVTADGKSYDFLSGGSVVFKCPIINTQSVRLIGANDEKKHEFNTGYSCQD